METLSTILHFKTIWIRHEGFLEQPHSFPCTQLYVLSFGKIHPIILTDPASLGVELSQEILKSRVIQIVLNWLVYLYAASVLVEGRSPLWWHIFSSKKSCCWRLCISGLQEWSRASNWDKIQIWWQNFHSSGQSQMGKTFRKVPIK